MSENRVLIEVKMKKMATATLNEKLNSTKLTALEREVISEVLTKRGVGVPDETPKESKDFKATTSHGSKVYTSEEVSPEKPDEVIEEKPAKTEKVKKVKATSNVELTPEQNAVMNAGLSKGDIIRKFFEMNLTSSQIKKITGFSSTYINKVKK